MQPPHVGESQFLLCGHREEQEGGNQGSGASSCSGVYGDSAEPRRLGNSRRKKEARARRDVVRLKSTGL